MLTLRRLALATILVLAVAACGGDDDTASPDPSSTADVSTTSTTSEPSDTGEPSADTTELSTYFLDGDGHIRVGWVRSVDSTAVARGTLAELLAGPGDGDESMGLSTAIPEGTELIDVNVAGGIATVDLSDEFIGGDAADMPRRLAQIVYTVTQFPTVDEVEILVAGAVEAESLTRADFQFGGTYEGIEPIVLVETPRPGEIVEGDIVAVGGFSNTFEAAVYIEIVTDDGEIVVPETYTMATAGTGTTGVFQEMFEIPAGTGDVVARAYDLSGEDGVGRVGVTEVPFTRQ
ncbi:MAG: GerMN domain-containing protein [Acidimicrobiia bacterium]|nr:GerMN domain-containing protein [Acidimicrobiia bacterium]